MLTISILIVLWLVVFVTLKSSLTVITNSSAAPEVSRIRSTEGDSYSHLIPQPRYQQPSRVYNLTEAIPAVQHSAPAAPRISKSTQVQETKEIVMLPNGVVFCRIQKDTILDFYSNNKMAKRYGY